MGLSAWIWSSRHAWCWKNNHTFWLPLTSKLPIDCLWILTIMGFFSVVNTEIICWSNWGDKTASIASAYYFSIHCRKKPIIMFIVIAPEVVFKWFCTHSFCAFFFGKTVQLLVFFLGCDTSNDSWCFIEHRNPYIFEIPSTLTQVNPTMQKNGN